MLFGDTTSMLASQEFSQPHFVVVKTPVLRVQSEKKSWGQKTVYGS